MKKLNKGLALMLALIMTVSMLATAVFADEAAPVEEEVVIHAILDEATPYSVLDETYVRYLGRGEITEKGRSMNWSMSGIEFTFTGTTAEVEVTTNDKKNEDYRAQFNVSVDGGEPQRMMMYTGWNTICTDLEEGTHTVQFVRSSEGMDSQLYMTAIRTDSETAPVPTRDKTRRIEFLGDSYACGYGNLPELVDNVKCAKNTDAWQAYPAYIMRHFNADGNVIAVSGKGVCMNYATKVTKIDDKNVMPVQFLSSDMIRSDEKHEEWNFNEYQPQVMVIYLGTNDYNDSVKDEKHGAGSNPEYFIEKYEEMLYLIREKYPETHILCVSKPFQCYHEELSALIEEMAKEDDKLHRLVLEEFHASAVHGHPNAQQHEQTAGYIIEAIEAIPDVWSEDNPEIVVKENEDKSVDVYLNNNEITFDVEPVVVNDRTLVPMRAIFEDLGAAVEWSDEKQTASAVKGETTITITIGGAFTVNGEPVEIDVPAQLVDDRTMVPLRVISESFGCTVAWEGFEMP